jgi:uncharacterized protein YecA (UPF0149 family)
MDEHKRRPDIEYYPFTKKQLLKAGESGFVDLSPAMEKLIQFLLNHYDLTKQEIKELTEQLTMMIIKDGKPSALIEYLQSRFEFPSMEFVQQVFAHLVEVQNQTRMWVLKGYSPNELFEQEKKHLKPLPNTSMRKSTRSNVIEIKSQVGRNSPCPCGSGKKYKKCCG